LESVLAPSQSALEILLSTVQDLTSTLSTEEVIRRLLQRVVLHLDSEIASILLLGRDDMLRISHAEGLPQEVVETTCIALGHGISGHTAKIGEPQLVVDVERHPVYQRRNHERYYTHSAVSVPLLNRGDVVGVINVNNKRSREPYSYNDLKLVEAMAGHAAVALANAHAFEETLERARTDALTGLANHGHFWTTLEAEMARAQRYGRELSLALLDVDRFKEYNDHHGHRGGDEALAKIARVIRERSRLHDTPARYGGEEFAIILPETPLVGAVAFAEKIRQTVEAETFAQKDMGGLTVSIGLARFPGEALNATQLVECADGCLYEAKARGRNCVVSSD